MIRRSALLAFTASLILGALPMVSAKDGDTAAMTKQQADSLLESSKLKSIKKKSDIPKIYWDAMGLEPMADVGGQFDAGCTGSAPHSRLVAGAVGDRYACIISEQGGIAYFKQFRVFKNENNSIKCVYTEMVNQDERCNQIKRKLSG